MTVSHLIQCTNLGGMEKAACVLMEALAQDQGTGFAITTPRPFGACEQRLKALDPDARAHAYKGKFGWRSQREFAASVQQKHTPGSPIMITGTDVACLRAIQQLEGSRVLAHHYHHFESRVSPLKWRLFYELGCRQLDAITYPSDFTRQEAHRIAPWLKGRTHVVPVYFEVTYDPATYKQAQRQARLELGLPEGAFLVGNAGWLTQRKRWDVFLLTAKQVLQQLPQTHFVVVGGGPEAEELHTLARDLGLADHVTFTGWQKDVDRYFEAFDILLFNSDFDTLPRTPGEAMGRGCVVVASLKYGGLGELVHHERNGILLPEHDTAALAQHILRLHADPGLRERYRAAAVQTLEQRHSRQAATGFYRDFFENHKPSA
jgi:glycosyltransferase involved in cell wall biosynthesis